MDRFDDGPSSVGSGAAARAAVTFDLVGDGEAGDGVGEDRVGEAGGDEGGGDEDRVGEGGAPRGPVVRESGLGLAPDDWTRTGRSNPVGLFDRTVVVRAEVAVSRVASVGLVERSGGVVFVEGRGGGGKAEGPDKGEGDDEPDQLASKPSSDRLNNDEACSQSPSESQPESPVSLPQP